MNSIKPFNRYDSSKMIVNDVNLPPIKDEDIAKILFLSTEPVQSNMRSGRGPTTSSNSIKKLLEKFKMALRDKSVRPIRRALQTRLFVLKNYSESDTFSVLEKNFSDVVDILNEDEEDILELTEIFEVLSIPVPQFLKSKYEVIIKKKNVPVPLNESGSEFKRFLNASGDELKTFFVYTENKVISQICDKLTPEDVFRIYSSVKEEKEEIKEFSDIISTTLDEKSLRNIPGLKNVAFYYLILQMMDHQLINRLHTHYLEFFLSSVKKKYELENVKDLSRFDEALRMLKRYPVSSYPPGLCIIFSMSKGREGSEEDVKIVKDLFEKKYRYHVLPKIDPTKKDIQTVVSKLQAPRNKFYDSLVVWFMGHGSLNHLTVMDGQIDRRKDFIEPLSDIEWLNKKPKLFFIQACSIEPLEGIEDNAKAKMFGLKGKIDSIPLDGASSKWMSRYGEYVDISCINNYADTLIAYATKEYKPAFRQGEGSIYVQTVVDQLKSIGHSESIENVLRRVHYNTNSVLLQTDQKPWKQTPFYECSFQKEFVFPKPE